MSRVMQLLQASDSPIPAAEITRRLQIPRELVYADLVGLESAGRAEIVVQFSNRGAHSAGWKASFPAARAA